MKVLVLGEGAREEALASLLRKSPLAEEVLTSGEGEAGTPDEIVALVQKEAVGFVVVGNDALLAAGLVDRLRTEGIECFGPTKAASEMARSEEYADDLMEFAGVPHEREGEAAGAVHALCAGTSAVPLIATAPLPRGEGTYAPLSLSLERLARIREALLLPVLRELSERGRPFTGFLSLEFGEAEEGVVARRLRVMPTSEESACLARLLKSDLLRLMLATARGTLRGAEAVLLPGAAVSHTLKERASSSKKHDTLVFEGRGGEMTISATGADIEAAQKAL